MNALVSHASRRIGPSPFPRNLCRLVILAMALLSCLPATLRAASRATPVPTLPPATVSSLEETNAFFPGTRYRPEIPTVEALLGFPAGQRAAQASEIERCLKAWTNAAPDRTRLVEYARSHEDRPLHYLILTAPRNLERLADIEENLARLGDPRRLTEAQAADLVSNTPPVAWLAYTIHGDETEGSDAALSVIHHLLAADDPTVTALLDDLVIIVDPLMNPDGRDRFLKMVAEHRGASPNLDSQSLLHSGYWPRGRGNHYLFDLNRDWLFAEHPETRGRIREIAKWNPILFVDAHGMGAHDTHLFAPPREPINPNIPASRHVWSERFATDQARAFDERGLVYYTGEWFEEWYPGYSDSWTSYRGGVGILYEQARIAADGVRRAGGRVLGYRESVLHHVIGSLANLGTARTHSKALLARLHATRRAALDPAGPYGKRTFAVLPTANASRLRDFAALLQLQGFELHTNRAALTVASAIHPLGHTATNVTLPAGTLLIPNRQPLGHLLAAFLEFDPRLSPAVLADERAEVLRTGATRIYDITSWNLTMMYGLDAWTLESDLPADTAPYSPASPQVAGVVTGEPARPVAWIFDGADDRSLAVAARLLERGVEVRAALKDFTFDGQAFARGSIVVTRLDNRPIAGDLAALLDAAARETGVPARAIASGLGAGDLPDLGGAYFQRLVAPRIATIARENVDPTDYGSIWFTLDHRLGIRHSQLDSTSFSDFDRYNVLVVPRGAAAVKDLAGPIKDWVRQGGTLIAIGDATGPFTAADGDFSRVRNLPDALARIGDFEATIIREWQARSATLPAASNIWSYGAIPKIEYPWQALEAAYPDEKELKRRDAWQSLFMPEGSFFSSRIDTNHWLTAGCREPLPILFGRGPVLMAGDGVDAPIRFGYLTPVAAPATLTNAAPASAETNAASRASNDSKRSEADAAKDKKEEKKDAPSRPGWAALPPGTAMNLRMSGLVWPEATHRIAHSAWVTRETIGRGQVILFASPPTFRAGARGTARVFLNAVVLAPGLGTSPAILP